MSGDDTGQDVAPDEDGWQATGEPTTGSTPKIETPIPHSRLVGFMAEPLARTVPFRRSTVLMLVAFLGFGALTWIYPPAGAAPSGGTSVTSGGVPGIFVPTPTTTTTRPPATTPTQPGATTTTGAPGTTSTTTTTTSPGPPGSSTTTTSGVGRTTTTTTTTVGGAATSTTTTTAP